MRRLAAGLTSGWAAVAGTAAAASIALAMLVLTCVFVAVAVPRASLGYRTEVLQRTLRAAPSSQTAVLASAYFTGLKLNAGELEYAQQEFMAGLHRDGLPLAPARTEWSGLATGSSPFSVAGRPADTKLATPQLELVYRSGMAGNARLVAGSMPDTAVTSGARAIQVIGDWKIG